MTVYQKISPDAKKKISDDDVNKVKPETVGDAANPISLPITINIRPLKLQESEWKHVRLIVLIPRPLKIKFSLMIAAFL